MKKEYYVEDPKQIVIENLIAQGVKVTATSGEIHKIEIDTLVHNIDDIETLTGLKFTDKKTEV